MILKKITSKGEQKLSNLLDKNLDVGYSVIQKIIRNKDVKVNGKRISSDVKVLIDDIVEVYLPEFKFKILYEDADIVVEDLTLMKL